MKPTSLLSNPYSSTSFRFLFLLPLLLLGVPISSLQGSVISTSGNSFNLNFGLTWEGGAVPWRVDTATIVHPGEYFLPDGAVVEFGGLNVLAENVAIVGPATTAATIELGVGGITADHSLDRIGHNARQPLILEVGENDQVWDFWAVNGVGAEVSGSATITHTDGDNRLWLRGSNWAFTGVWRSDGGFIHPHTNFQWSNGAAGATGQLLNGGIIRLSNSLYDRVRLEMVGDGTLLTSGAASDNGARSIMAPGQGEMTGDIFGSGTLTVDSWSDYGRLQLDGNIYHVGDTVVADAEEGMFLELSADSSFTFHVAADGTSSRIRGESLDGSHLFANGELVINFSDEAYSGGEWLLIDHSSLNVEFGQNLSVQGFSSDQTGLVWTRPDGDESWTFDLQTGVLERSGEAVDDGLVLVPGVVTEDTLLGKVTGVTDSSGFSPMLRAIHVGLYPDYIYSASLGWLLQSQGSASTGIYFFRADVENWIWLHEDAPGYFWDLATGSWMVF